MKQLLLVSAIFFSMSGFAGDGHKHGDKHGHGKGKHSDEECQKHHSKDKCEEMEKSCKSDKDMDKCMSKKIEGK